MIEFSHDKNVIQLAGLIRLFARGANWKMPLAHEDWHELLQHTPLLVTAWKDGQLVGFARLLTDFVRWANLYDVVVDPDFQRQGIGSQLVRRLLDHPRLARVRTFGLGTAEGHDFYERFGFVRDGTGHGMLLVRRNRDERLAVGSQLAEAATTADPERNLARPSFIISSETVTFSGTGGRQLVGTLREVDSEQLVLLAHGFTSDRLSRGRFPRLADALAMQGISSLAFDFSGCGESDDAVLTLDSQVWDLRAAIEFAKARGFERLALFGHSLGSLVCLHAYTPDVQTLVLTGALTGPMNYHWSDHYSADQLDELARTGRLVVRHAEGPRRETIVGAEMLRAFGSVDPAALLPHTRCPVLMVLGDGDDEERQLLEHARRALPLLPDGSRLQVIAGAPHGFGEAYDQVIDTVVGWFVRRLRPNSRGARGPPCTASGPRE